MTVSWGKLPEGSQRVSLSIAKTQFATIGLFQKKIHTPITDGILEILARGGSKTLEIQAEGGLTLKKSSVGVISTDSSRMFSSVTL